MAAASSSFTDGDGAQALEIIDLDVEDLDAEPPKVAWNLVPHVDRFVVQRGAEDRAEYVTDSTTLFRYRIGTSRYHLDFDNEGFGRIVDSLGGSEPVNLEDVFPCQLYENSNTGDLKVVETLKGKEMKFSFTGHTAEIDVENNSLWGTHEIKRNWEDHNETFWRSKTKKRIAKYFDEKKGPFSHTFLHGESAPWNKLSGFAMDVLKQKAASAMPTSAGSEAAYKTPKKEKNAEKSKAMRTKSASTDSKKRQRFDL
jgi:hypothetical protein